MRDHLALHPRRPPRPAGAGQREWLVAAVLAACTGLAIVALAAGPSMPTWAMISVIVGWLVGWSVIGAWRMMTRDA